MRRSHLQVALVSLTFIPLAWLANASPFLKDAGELTSSMWNAGIAHPTGFPAMQSGAGLFRALPLGAAPLRVAWLSALCAALVVLLMGLTVAHLVSSRKAEERSTNLFGVLAGTGLVLTDVAWFHALNVEVYLPSLLALAGLVLLAVRALETGFGRHWRLFALLGGVSVGLHVTVPVHFLVAGCVVVISIGRREVRSGRAVVKQALWPALPLFLAGALVLLYLPLRAGQSPVRMWADTSSLAGLIGHITGRSIRTSFEGTMLATGDAAWRHLQLYGVQVVTMAGTWLPLVAVGCYSLARKRSAAALVLAGIFISDALFAIFVNPMGMAEKQTSLPSLLVLGILAAAGTAWLTDKTMVVAGAVRGAVVPVVLTVAVVLLVLSPVRSLSPAERLSRIGPHGDRMVQAAFAGLVPDGLLVTSQDDMSALAMYFKEVERRRPDVLTMVKHFVCDGLAHQQAAEVAPDHAALPAWTSSMSRCTGHAEEVAGVWNTLLPELASLDQAVRWELGDGAVDRSLAAVLVPGYPLFDVKWGLSQEEQKWRLDQFVAEMTGMDRFLRQHFADDISKVVISEYFRLAGTFVLQRSRFLGKEQPNCELLAEAVRLDESNCRSWNNLGVCLVLAGRVEDGLRACTSGKLACPLYTKVRLSELRYLMQLRRHDEARAALLELQGDFDQAEWLPVVEQMRNAAREAGDQAAADALEIP